MMINIVNMIISISESIVVVFVITSPIQIVDVYSFILDIPNTIGVVFIYIPSFKRGLNDLNMIFTPGPTVLFFKDNIMINNYLLEKGSYKQ